MSQSVSIGMMWLVVLSSMFAAEPERRVPSAEEMRVHLSKRPEHDVIQWKDEKRGAPLQVRILEVRSREMTVQKTAPSGMLTRKIPLGELSGISLTLSETERSLIEFPDAASAPALRVLWEARHELLETKTNHIPEMGIAFAKSLRMADPVPSYDEARSILERVAVKTDSAKLQAAVRAELQTLDLARALVTGPPEKTDQIAWAVTESDDNPEAMLMATSWLADRHFRDLQELEQNHPRWMEDDEVKPIRERLYHLSLDFAIYPSLFHPLDQERAALGLSKAWKVHQYAGESELALQKLQDIAALYPDSSAAVETGAELARLLAMQAKGQPIEAESATEKMEPEPDDKATLPAVPPEPKKYNLFQD